MNGPSFDVYSLGPLALSSLSSVLADNGYMDSAIDILIKLSEKEGPLSPEYLSAIGGFMVKYLLGISIEGGKLQKRSYRSSRIGNISGHFITPDGKKTVIGDRGQ